jgi:hypothetical protein
MPAAELAAQDHSSPARVEGAAAAAGERSQVNCGAVDLVPRWRSRSAACRAARATSDANRIHDGS